uniref:Pre-mRNA cleavage complex 2 protein Pcf11 n=2 Tax=Nothobranchius rachovii TaxID=451742 RepID=A0A1A8SA63_9TELE
MKNKPNPAEFVSPAAKRLSNVLMDSLLMSGDGTDHTVVGFSGSLSSKMDDAVAREDACREYQSSLEDLTFNSKPHINMLTILAEENVQFAKDIVAIIEAQISKAPTIEKLPVLYLVDSIVKNVGGEYLAVFAKNLITSFICVFEKVDENTRKSLFKLRSTWDEVFPLKKLYALDVRVNSLDPAWPIKPLPSPTNAIHVNPKFLKQSEEASSPQAAPTHPPAVTPVPKPVSQLAPVISQSSLTQEQLIRQQLLAKQKQLLELQQKKIELELEQTKAQLMGQAGFISPAPTASSSLPKPDTVVRPWVPPQPQPDSKPSNRDPRLTRVVPPAAPQPKEQLAVKRESPALPPERRLPEKPTQLDKPGTRKGFSDDKSKSPSPLARSLHMQNKQLEAKFQKSTDGPRKDPRLKKRPQDKAGMSREDEQKKKRCSDKKDREEAPRGPDSLRVSKAKLVNGSMVTHDRNESSERPDFKTGGNARTHARKRTRSRSPAGSPKRKDRRSPKSKTRSRSPSPSHKPGKPQRIRAGDLQHGKPGRDERLGLKKNKSESRRPKRLVEDHHSESRDSPRSHEGGSKEAKEAHRWRSGWEENKRPKPSEDPHTKAGPQRHKSYSTPTRPSTPRNPKHRLSVDANLQIPEVLNSASKKDLLQRASRRLESGEISLEDFLNMAHQIKHFFQYQEEKQQRTKGWEGPGEFPVKKRSLLSSPPSAQSHPHEAMDPAELSYYEHKSKLRTTRVNHRVMGEETQESQEDGSEMGQGEMTSDLISGNPPSHRYSRGPQDRPGERRSKEHDESRPALAPMIEDYNHGKEFPKLKGLRFRRRADPRESSEREWTSPLTERQLYDDREEQKSGYDAPRRYPTSADQRRQEGPSGTGVHRNSSSSVGPEAPLPRFERERLSPLHQKDAADSSPIPRFESPNSEHSDDGPLDVPHSHPPHKPILLRGGPLPSVQQHEDSPGLTPPHEANHPPSRYSGPGHMGPSRSRPGWFEGGAPPGCYNDPQFEGPQHPGPSRFDGGGPPYQVENTDGSGSCEGHHMAHGPVRGDGMGRFGGPMDPQPPVTFEGPLLGPGPLEGPIQHFNNAGPGSMGFQQQRPLRFEPPSNQMGLMRFEGPGQPGPRFDLPSGPLHGGPAGFDYPPGQQGGPRFVPQHNPQAPVQPMAPPIYDNSIPSQQNFNMGPQRFPDPLNPQFPTGPNMQQPGSFNMQPLPFSHSVPRPFFTPSAPPMGQQQPMNMMNQNFLPQNPGPYGQQTHPVAPPENHFGQVDVNDLLSKLVSNGIIKPLSQVDAAPTPSEFTLVATAPPAEEEEEEEPEVEEDDFPDLTSFSIEHMKQRYESVVTKLYSGNQCCLCSMRFTTAQTDMYADHLDWHFRQNHAGKVASKKVTHRRWYYSLTDWIEFEEIADLEERAKSQFFEKENEEEVQKSQAAAKEKEFQSVRAAKDQVGELCEICQESFETYWVEEEEDWFLKNAIRVDEKNFHPACFEDYKNTSSYLDVTPSPSKLLTEHPLGTFLKMEEEKVTSCDAITVKQEVPSESCELPQEDQNQGQDVLTDPVKSENTA